MSELPDIPASRPTLVHPDRIAKILKETAKGQTVKVAAQAAGISRTSLQLWKAKGEKRLATARLENPDIEDVIDDWLQLWPHNFLATNGMWDAPIPAPFTERTEWHLVLFATLLEQARGMAEAKLVRKIFSSSQWQASAWLLERRNRPEYGRNQTVALTGPDGGAVQVEAASSEEVLAKIAEFKRVKAEKG
jgi:hypothetical protein